MAEVIGVDRTTITRWKKTPEARQAIKSAIALHLQKMEQLGDGDWKMHREMLKMLGVKDSTTIEHEAGESIGAILEQIEKTNYESAIREAKEQVVADEQPVQNQEQGGRDSNLPTE